MFDRFTDKAKRVLFFARYEASQFGTPQIDTELLLLGILREDKDLLPSLIGPDVKMKIRNRIQQQSPPKEAISTSKDLPFSEASIRVLKYAEEEADQSKSHAITDQHILIGLLREKGCLAQSILNDLGITPEVVHDYPKHEKTAEDVVLGKRALGKAVPNDAFRKAIIDAADEATSLHLMSARPEHLLLALLRDEHSLASKILKEAGLTYEGVLKRLE